MLSKSNLIATIVTAIVMFLLGYVIWGVGTVSFFEGHTLNNIMKDPPNLGLIFVANLIEAFAMSTLYSKWARGSHSAKEGFQFGAWIGVFIGLGSGLLWFATAELMDMTGVLVEAILEIVFFGIAGAIIAIVYQKTAAKTA